MNPLLSRHLAFVAEGTRFCGWGISRARNRSKPSKMNLLSFLALFQYIFFLNARYIDLYRLRRVSRNDRFKLLELLDPRLEALVDTELFAIDLMFVWQYAVCLKEIAVRFALDHALA